jgi:hypothetical protein
MAMLAKTAHTLFAESAVDPIHDILIPELATVQASLELVRNEIDSIRAGIRVRDEVLRAEIKLRTEHMEQLIRSCDESNAQALSVLSEKLDRALNLSERSAAVEDGLLPE